MWRGKRRRISELKGRKWESGGGEELVWSAGREKRGTCGA